MHVHYTDNEFHIVLYQQASFGPEIDRLANAVQVTNLTTYDGTDLGKRIEVLMDPTLPETEVQLSPLGQEAGVPYKLETCIGLRFCIGTLAHHQLKTTGGLSIIGPQYTVRFQIREIDPARVCRN